MKNLFKKVFLGVAAFVMIACVSYTKPVYAASNVTQTKSMTEEMIEGVINLYDGLFEIIYGEDYDRSELMYNYKTETFSYKGEEVTEEQLEWLIYYFMYIY